MNRRKFQMILYRYFSKHKLFHPLLFLILKRKNFLDKTFDKIIRNYAYNNPNFFFVQIGANDGLKADPMYLYVKKYNWSGILVEPVSYIFEKLKENYRDTKNLFFENIAIGDKNSYKDFYRLKQISHKNVPLWYDEIGSFLKENVTKHKDKFPELENYLITEKIKCLTLSSLFKKYNLKKIDLLQIDAEGYDYHIVKQIPFNKFKPVMIRYEDRHLSLEQKKYCKDLLFKNGYKVIDISGDSFAYLNKNIQFNT